MIEELISSETSVLTRATGVTSKKTPFFVVTAVKTSDLTHLSISLRLWEVIFKIQKKTQWPLVRERTIPTERPPLVHEI
jgi:hypothetical protein